MKKIRIALELGLVFVVAAYVLDSYIWKKLQGSWVTIGSDEDKE